jgi:hypothetical protein
MAFDAEPSSAPKGRLIASIILFLLLMGGTPALAQFWGIEGPALLPFFLPALAGLVWMSREARAYSQRRGCATSAGLAYNRRVLPLAAAYVVVMLGAILMRDRLQLSGPALYVIAVLPALPLVGVVWALGRFLVEETDEYQRAQTVRKMLVATGFLLVVTTIWGFLEEFRLVPHLAAYWCFIVWCAGLGIGACWNRLRA